MRSLTLSPEGDLLVAFEAEFAPAGSIFSASAVVAVDPATGVERWRYVDGDASTNRSISSLTLWENLVLYSDATGQEAVAFDRGTRAVVWRASSSAGFIGTRQAPLVEDGTAYFADGGGAAFAVDARTGARKWVTNLPGGAYSFEVCGPYFLMNNGPIEIVERSTGKHRGRLLDDDDSAGYTAVADNVLYVGGRRGVYAYDCGR